MSVDAQSPSTSRLAGLTGATIETAPSVCRTCLWWQSRGTREPDKASWIARAEEEWGAWGTIYRDDDGRVIGSMQYGPSGLFPRAVDLPAGPPSEDAVLVTCSYLLSDTQPWVEQSLFLAAIGEARACARGVRLPLPRVHALARALPRPPHRLPARLPRGLRLPDRAGVGEDRARAARPRRARPRRGGRTGEGPPEGLRGPAAGTDAGTAGVVS